MGVGPLGWEDAPRYATRWEESWYLALERLGDDVEGVDRQLEHVYYRLERWPERYSYPAPRLSQTTRLTFAKVVRGFRLRVWYRIDEQAGVVPLLWVDVAPFDEGQDDPF